MHKYTRTAQCSTAQKYVHPHTHTHTHTKPKMTVFAQSFVQCNVVKVQLFIMPVVALLTPGTQFSIYTCMPSQTYKAIVC